MNGINKIMKIHGKVMREGRGRGGEREDREGRGRNLCGGGT
jgi:hypothetical protein